MVLLGFMSNCFTPNFRVHPYIPEVSPVLTGCGYYLLYEGSELKGGYEFLPQWVIDEAGAMAIKSGLIAEDREYKCHGLFTES